MRARKCPNCGANVKAHECEYCGTVFDVGRRTDIRVGVLGGTAGSSKRIESVAVQLADYLERGRVGCI